MTADVDRAAEQSRPCDDVEQLRRAADIMDQLDVIASAYAQLVEHRDPITGNEVQADLRRIADVLEQLQRKAAVADEVVARCEAWSPDSGLPYPVPLWLGRFIQEQILASPVGPA